MDLGDLDDVRVRADHGVTVRVAGDLDFASAPDVGRSLREAVASSTGTLTVDCSALGFTDSSGLSVLVGCWRLLHAEGRELRLTGVGSELRRLLDITGLAGPLHATA